MVKLLSHQMSKTFHICKWISSAISTFKSDVRRNAFRKSCHETSILLVPDSNSGPMEHKLNYILMNVKRILTVKAADFN